MSTPDTIEYAKGKARDLRQAAARFNDLAHQLQELGYKIDFERNQINTAYINKVVIQKDEATSI